MAAIKIVLKEREKIDLILKQQESEAQAVDDVKTRKLA
jgi:hypothetical protein